MRFDIEEGKHLDSGQQVGYIDTMQLYLHKKQLLSNVKAILVTKPDINKDIASIEQQITNAEKEKRRTENLVNANAAPQKQLDDINEQLAVLQKQLDERKSSLSINTAGIQEQSKPVYYQAQQIDDQIKKSIIVNPVSGTVLTKYAEFGEITSSGKALYRIADLSVMTLRVYISNSQLSQVEIGQQVKVYIDSGEKTYKEMTGTIKWVSDKAEFTPKTIQTKEERANLVYAVKIDVKNNGFLKIGMYGEVKFNHDDNNKPSAK
ncbi:MAG TPA: HlyD family efflux transporter periplasmic adaptor subunit, partial [Cytophagaceae bacterium]|nr:HlyD family efflux transporter periplasmic adaptor subunit [Cytophagaceae bacterium]